LKGEAVKILIFICLLVYLTIGVFICGIINEEWQKLDMITVLSWPILVILFIVLGIINGVYELGQKLHDKLNN
jgi:uncharacterized protein YneF (UPF0154 family)